MNKKILTLSTGLMLSSALAFAADVKDLKVVSADSFKSGNNYYVVADRTGDGLTADDIILNLAATGDDLNGSATTAISSADLSAKGFVFKVTSGTDLGGKINYYSLYGVDAEAYLAGENATIVVTKSAAKESEGRFWNFNNGSVAIEKYDGNANLLRSKKGDYSLELANASITLNGGAGSKIFFCVAQSENVSAETLNQTLGGEGLFLGFKDSDKVEGNVFEDTKLKAFEVSVITGVPSGLYFATEYPAELNGVNTITSLADFKKCTFIAVNPTSFKDVHKFDHSKGHGFTFETVAASSMNYALSTDAADEQSQNDEVYVGNACFTVAENDAVNAEGKYVLSLSNARLVVKADDKETTGDIKQNNPGTIYVAAPSDLGVNYLVTYESGVEFEAVKGNLVDPSSLIKSTKEASYYAIQLLSGEGEEVSEYGQYLTTNASGNWYSVPAADVNDPLYQFVVSSIDLTNKTATFTNRETGEYLTFSLYGEVEGMVFNLACTIPSASYAYAVNNNGSYSFSSTGKLFSASKVKLVPVTVEDKYASFFNADEATTMVSFKLAKSDVASEKLFVVADGKANGNVKESDLIASETDADKFILYKSVNSTDLQTNDFAYMEGKNARVATNKDTVAYYTYKIKLYQDNDDEAGYYLAGTLDLSKSNSIAGAQSWKVKTTDEGSVYVSALGSSLFLNVANTIEEGDAVWGTANFYNFAEMLNRNVKTYLVPEAPAVSLEAKGQHVAFQAERGGYISMNENGQAVVAVKAMADEDLTFWLDTADSKKTVPSFLISKGGKFLYNAADSAVNLVNGADYIINNDKSKCRMIFKAGSYADNLLVTTINGKETTVAEKADALKKYVGGLNNFKFRIVKSEDEGYYFIRPVGKDGSYVQNLNGELTTTTDKKEALRVEVEAMEAPTSNESVSASEVAVVAQNGSVVVKNAAGKNVVVSTILGQVVANEVLTSDNATINVPAGIVVVAVEGESFKVNVK